MHGFTAPVHVRWSDIDMYQHINHATMVTILEEARIPFLREPFGDEITTIGLLIAEVNIAYKKQVRLVDSPLQVTMWSKRVRTVDFTVGYEVRSVGASPDSKPAVIESIVGDNLAAGPKAVAAVVPRYGRPPAACRR